MVNERPRAEIFARATRHGDEIYKTPTTVSQVASRARARDGNKLARGGEDEALSYVLHLLVPSNCDAEATFSLSLSLAVTRISLASERGNALLTNCHRPMLLPGRHPHLANRTNKQLRYSTSPRTYN